MMSTSESLTEDAGQNGLGIRGCNGCSSTNLDIKTADGVDEIIRLLPKMMSD